MRFTHVIATRNGLFLAHRDGHRRVADGTYFGATILNGYVYCFDAVEPSTSNQESGIIVRFAILDNELGEPEIMLSGLHTGCHQIDFVGDHLFIVDTYRQQIIEIDRKWRLADTHWPLPQTADRQHDDYAHINSIFHRDGKFHILMHNMGRRQSEILITDDQFNALDRQPLNAESAHDLVLLEDGTFLTCNSKEGQLSWQSGRVEQIDALFTRGLSVNADEIVVGSSLFGQRGHRDLLPGFVTFLGRDLKRTGRLHIEASPTQIHRLDGNDYSLSNYHSRVAL